MERSWGAAAQRGSQVGVGPSSRCSEVAGWTHTCISLGSGNFCREKSLYFGLNSSAIFVVLWPLRIFSRSLGCDVPLQLRREWGPALLVCSVSSLGSDFIQLHGHSQLFICFCQSVGIYKKNKAPNIFLTSLI